jgi:hypothetical protein
MNIIDFLRQFRIGQFSIFDFAVSYLGLFLLAPIIIKGLSYFKVHMTKMNIMWLVLPLAILVHLIVGKYTPMTKMFLDLHNYYFLKALILFMIYMGFRGVIW